MSCGEVEFHFFWQPTDYMFYDFKKLQSNICFYRINIYFAEINSGFFYKWNEYMILLHLFLFIFS